MEWVRGDQLGYGSFATVSLAIPRKASAKFPPLMAVKSSDSTNSASLRDEKQVLDQLGDCPQIIRCFGDDYSFENGERRYNLFLEYASNGSLADQLKENNGGLAESDVRRYTKSILKALSYVHSKGFVHCDLKLPNILVFDNGEIKIADFGLAQKSCSQKKSNTGLENFEVRGTPLYMAPESINDNEYESPADIWALGCAIVEMMTGKPAWNFPAGLNIWAIMMRIGGGEELPGIPEELSEEAKDFLGNCFVKDPRNRWTAEMLLNHPFCCSTDGNFTVSLKDSEKFSASPKSPFDFPEWVSIQTSCSSSPETELWSGNEMKSSSCSLMSPAGESSPLDRIKQLLSDEEPHWVESASWVAVR